MVAFISRTGYSANSVQILTRSTKYNRGRSALGRSDHGSDRPRENMRYRYTVCTVQYTYTYARYTLKLSVHTKLKFKSITTQGTRPLTSGKLPARCLRFSFMARATNAPISFLSLK